VNLGVLVVLITVNFAIALLGVYLVLRSTRRYLKKTLKRIRRQRNQDLRWHRDTLLAQMRLEEARRH
jgi:Uri superfamily endonuclease